MFLLYMYFENGKDEDGNYETYKGIEPNLNGYTFDNRFIVTFKKNENTFYIKDNPNFVQIYNNNISSFSCIVGKNGSGKTTFIELLISNIVWGITKYQPYFMISIYYQKNKRNKYEFFIQNYKSSTSEYKYYYNDSKIKKNFKDNHAYNDNSSSTIPQNTKYIFHSLSPFDKIFYSIGVPLKEYPQKIEPFKNRIKYIGNKNIFKDDSKHEILTITNLINLFSNDYFATPFKEILKYEFRDINVNFETLKYIAKEKEFFIELNILVESIELKLKNQSDTKSSNLKKFSNLSIKEKEEFFTKLISQFNLISKNFSDEGTLNDFLFVVFIDNINFNKLTDFRILKSFLSKINFENIVQDNKISIEDLIKNLFTMDLDKEVSFLKDSEFIKDVLKNTEIIQKILEINSYSLEDIRKIENLKDVIFWIRKLKNRNYLEFELNLFKNREEINYFYLSSGEKAMISYFANISQAIKEFKDRKDKTFIMLIDEVELHLHPEWQRNFIEYMNLFFRESNLNMKYQFIIATHSPFVLSDIIEDNIIYLSKDEAIKNEHNTFGANIYDIFEKGFFLQNSIGLCSEKFIEKISNVILFLKAIILTFEDDWFLLENYTKYQHSKEDLKIKRDEFLNKKIRTFNKQISKNEFFEFVEINESGDLNIKDKLEYSINIIGEPVIKEHLLDNLNFIKEISINVYE